ncbi:MAG: hypothetical protein ACRDT2_18805, partial [Natronosporangium sp.]
MAGAVAFLLLPVSAVAGLGSPAVAQVPAAGCEGTLVAADEPAALVLAAECGLPVEVELSRGFAEREFAQPDGTMTLESYARPQWAWDEAGDWVDVDPTLQLDEAAGDRISTVATVFDIEVSSGGAGPFVTAGDPVGRSISLSWPEVLPAPVLAGPTATYPGVFEDVDLRVTAGEDWFSYSLVVHTPEAGLNPALQDIEVQVTTVGLATLQTADGSVVARDSGGEPVFASYGALMWDSPSPEPAEPAGVDEPVGGDIPGAEPGRVAQVEVELAGSTLRVSPDQAMLADPETTFPVTIDPTFTSPQLAWTLVGNGIYADATWWNDGAWPRNQGLRMGFQGWDPPDGSGGRWRSMARFDIHKLRGSIINSASARVTVFHTGGCGSYPLQLWQTNGITHGQVPTSWNSTSSGFWLHGAPLDTRTVASANKDVCGSNPDRNVTFSSDLLEFHVQRSVDQPFQSMTFGLRAGNEADKLQWMRAYPGSFALVVNYTPVTPVPAGLSVDGSGCLAPAAGRAVGSAPVLAGAVRHSEGTVKGQLEVQQVGVVGTVRSWTSAAVSSGSQLSWAVDPPLPDGAYRWRMRAVNPATGVGGAWSSWCTFAAEVARDAEPGPEAGGVECPVAAGEPLAAADEATALLLA